MRLEAHLTTSDLRHLLVQLTPLSVALDPGSPQRQLAIQPPSKVALEKDRGLRVVTELRLRWDVIGVTVPVTLQQVEILLLPRIETFEDQPALGFGLRIENADLSAIPAFLRGVLVARVNEALARPDVRVVWRFMDTLDFQFPLPPQIQPSVRMRVFARGAQVQVQDDALRLAVDWGLALADGLR